MSLFPPGNNVTEKPGRAWLSAPWLPTFSRSVAAIVGGYAFASVLTAFLALTLPLARSQAVLAAMLIAIAAYACAAMWVFATSSATRAWIGLAVPTLVMAAVVWWLGGAP